MNFDDHGIYIKETTGQARTTCPKCSPTRRKATDPCLSVDVDEGLFYCHHCGWSGSLNNGHKPEEIKRHFKRPEYKWTDLPENVVVWFKKRGISERILRLNQIGYGNSFGEIKAIQFPYVKHGEVVNIKHRTHDKRFRQEKGAEKCLYRFDEIAKGGTTLIVTEGEIDALTFQEAGFESVCSIPDGAPSAEAKEYRTKFDFLDSATEIIAGYENVIIATDSDAPGRVAEKELARRIGIEKCSRVEYPEGCKDANDVLVKHGPTAVQALVRNAQPFPISGLFSIGDLKSDIECLYDEGVARGKSTGFINLDKLYTVSPGRLTIVTGIPGSGKSEFLDAVLVNMISCHDWKFAVCSPENWPPQVHAQKFIEKIVSKPFAKSSWSSYRMERREIDFALGQVKEHIYFIMPQKDDEFLTVDYILDRTRIAIRRHGVNGLVIDPWNELEHMMDKGEREDMYISRILSKLRRFARRNGIHIWLVAHPQKLQKDKDTGGYKPPTMYEISGGAHWRNKADMGLCVHRPDIKTDVTEVYVQKVRFKYEGSIGETKFRYSRDAGTYHPVADEDV